MTASRRSRKIEMSMEKDRSVQSILSAFTYAQLPLGDINKALAVLPGPLLANLFIMAFLHISIETLQHQKIAIEFTCHNGTYLIR